MIAGGSEAAITPMAVGGFSALKALSTRNEEPARASRPFDLQRDGFVLGEGAGILILEELERARARGAHIYAEIVGYGMSGDAYHITAPPPDGDGAIRAMQTTIAGAGSPRTRSTTSTRTAPRRLRTTGRRPRRSGRSSGSTPTSWPSAPRNR